MMGVFTRPDSKYYYLYLEPTKTRMKTPILVKGVTPMQTSENRTLARLAYQNELTKISREFAGVPAPRPTITFSAYATWYDTHKIAKRRGVERDRSSLANLVAFFGSRDLASLDAAAVDEYETKRLTDRVGPAPKPGTEDHRPTVKPNTINREVDLLKQMLRDAVPKYLQASPIAGRRRLRVVKPKKRVLATSDELQRLLAALPDDEWRRFFRVALGTLMRLSNVINLRRDEDHGTHFALTDSKTGPYEVAISDDVRAALDAIPQNGPYYFPERRQAKTYRDQRGAVRRMLQRACRRCRPRIPYGRAVAGITWHTATRATGATWMLWRGADPKTVQEAGNWKDFRSMQGYLHTSRERVRDALNTIAAIPESNTKSTPRAKTPRNTRQK